MATDRYDVTALTVEDVRWDATGSLEVITNPYGLRTWTARISIVGVPERRSGDDALPVVVETVQGAILVGSAFLDLGAASGTDALAVSVRGTGDFSLI